MKIRISNIEWDTEGAADVDLPVELAVDAAAEGITDLPSLTDWLSNKFGWTVTGLTCDPQIV